MEPSPAGREELVRLIDRLVDRRRHGVPIVQLTGPGGAGKGEILRYLESRYRGTVPVARIDLSDWRTDDTQGLIEVVHGQLRTFSNRRRFGRLRMPRTELALAVRQLAARRDGPPATQRFARRVILAGRERIPPDPGGDGGGPVGVVVRSIWLAVLTVLLVRRFRVQFPSGVRRLFFPRDAAAWRWYERVGARLLNPNVRHSEQRVDDVVVEMITVAHAAAAEPDRSRSLDDLLVGAFLADVCAAYRFRAYRRVRCVLLIGNADLVEPEKNRSLMTGELIRHAWPGAEGGPLSRLLAVERTCCRHRTGRHGTSAFHLPLLVVTSSQAGPLCGDDDSPRRLFESWSAPRTSQDAVADDARTASTMVLPMVQLGWEASRAFLNQLSYRQAHTDLQPLRAAEIVSAARGHPHAMSLVLDEEARSLRDTGATVAARDVLSRPLVADELRSRFLQRFPDRGARPVRQQTVDILSVLANANRIDLAVLPGLLELCEPVPDGDPPVVFDRLRQYSFMSGTPEDGPSVLVMHPLLRDLLVRRLHQEHDETFRAVHRFLLGYFAPDGPHPDEAEHLYHRLALGDMAFVVDALDRHAAESPAHCSALLQHVCGAPGFDEWAGAGAGGTTGSTANALADMWALESITSTVEWDEARVARAIGHVDRLAGRAR